jgi:hypothetical protein
MKTILFAAIAMSALSAHAATNSAGSVGSPNGQGYECVAVAGVEGRAGTSVWGNASVTMEEARTSALNKCQMQTVWGNCAIDSCWFQSK